MRQQLFRVSAKHKITNKSIELAMWAENVCEATGKVSNILFGPDNEYIWTGSGPEYRNNEVVVREV